jgi:hypothetical protein
VSHASLEGWFVFPNPCKMTLYARCRSNGRQRDDRLAGLAMQAVGGNAVFREFWHGRVPIDAKSGIFRFYSSVFGRSAQHGYVTSTFGLIYVQWAIQGSNL